MLATNVVPSMLAPRAGMKFLIVSYSDSLPQAVEQNTAERASTVKPQLSPEQLEKLVHKVDLNRIQDWSGQEEKGSMRYRVWVSLCTG